MLIVYVIDINNILVHNSIIMNTINSTMWSGKIKEPRIESGVASTLKESRITQLFKRTVKSLFYCLFGFWSSRKVTKASSATDQMFSFSAFLKDTQNQESVKQAIINSLTRGDAISFVSLERRKNIGELTPQTILQKITEGGDVGNELSQILTAGLLEIIPQLVPSFRFCVFSETSEVNQYTVILRINQKESDQMFSPETPIGLLTFIIAINKEFPKILKISSMNLDPAPSVTEGSSYSSES